jgi:hypothetical protein
LNTFEKECVVDVKVWMYLIYLVISIGLTVWVARTLSRNGLVFLEDVFSDSRLAKAVNHLLVVGFYLLNLGYVTVAMKYGGEIATVSQALEELSMKVGLVLLVLGALHFFNVFALNRYRRSRLRQQAPHPPLPPTTRLPVAPPVPVGAVPGGPVLGGGGMPGMPSRPYGAPPAHSRPAPQQPPQPPRAAAPHDDLMPGQPHDPRPEQPHYPTPGQPHDPAPRDRHDAPAAGHEPGGRQGPGGPHEPRRRNHPGDEPPRPGTDDLPGLP